MTSVTEIAQIERAVKGKIYPPGTTLIQVSAVKSGIRENIFKYLEEPGEVEDKYACLIPDESIIRPIVFHGLIDIAIDGFLHRFVSGMNLQMKDFRFLTIPIPSREEQLETEKDILEINKQKKIYEESIKNWEKMKEIMMDLMFC
ncbi:hypothetical protein AAK706_07520 [Erysipelotrichaceae bacterium 66-17]